MVQGVYMRVEGKTTLLDIQRVRSGCVGQLPDHDDGGVELADHLS